MSVGMNLYMLAALLSLALPCFALDDSTLSTLGSLQSNVLSYLVVIIPAGLLIRYIKKRPELAAGALC